MNTKVNGNEKNITNQELKNYVRKFRKSLKNLEKLENGANNNCFAASLVCSCNI